MRLLALAGLAFFLTSMTANAHLASDSYLRIQIDAQREVNGQLDVALRDLDAAIGLDAGAEGIVTWGKLKAKRAAIEAYVLRRLTISGCALRPSDFMVDYHAGNAYAAIFFRADCPRAAGPLTLNYRLLFDLDPTHRGLLTLVQPTGERSDVLSPDHAEASLDAAPDSTQDEIGRFIGFGINHILLGYDHLLFVAVLLIMAAFQRAPRKGWKPLDGFGRVLVETLKILTAFTLAHAIALTLAVLGVVDVPSRFVDPAVALTIMLAAADNVWPILSRVRWNVAFGFGLIHGLAFASALTPMQLHPSGLALALCSFNIGVELGQVALALLLIPIVFVARREPIYLRALAPALSCIAFALALAWFIERTFGVFWSI
ncbi:HupE/UreJ family protein [Methylocapsa acidiphila]|uniref:Putative membrane protein n=1 Tax=Methylocapsa acidiphila TaxID=133552 RepID=Q2VNN9_METAI|nr:HupE/UreJ family protein [Methylocapsa acidiphila]CAJ01593.1 putative membrane protein [Methylocapsa acidiphila]